MHLSWDGKRPSWLDLLWFVLLACLPSVFAGYHLAYLWDDAYWYSQMAAGLTSSSRSQAVSSPPGSCMPSASLRTPPLPTLS
jgi:hypothetical protein